MKSSWDSDIEKVIARSDAKADEDLGQIVDGIVETCRLRSRVDTGRMRDGWRGEQTGEHSFEVDNPVEHTIYNEFGTRYMSAQPMLGPAIEEATPKLDQVAGNWYEG
jgi:HK97 gp10 family phage protein